MTVGKDRDRQGPGNVGGSASKGGAAASKGAAKGAAAAPPKEKEKGLFGGIKDFFSGGKKSGPTAADRPKARPDVVKTGTGKDAKFTDTRTGQSFAAPSYGAFSFKGLTSTDPANVARNRYGTDIRPMRGIEPANRNNRKDRGIASLVAPPAGVGAAPGAAPTTEPAPPTPEELAAIGAPTTPMGPVLVEPRTYTEYDLLDELGPAGGYGNAFMGGPQMPPINLMDIFAAYPNFGMR